MDRMNDLGIDFHREEESEVGVGSEAVQFLLQLDEPLWRQMDVLQHHPATGLSRRIDEFFRLAESLRGSYKHQTPRESNATVQSCPVCSAQCDQTASKSRLRLRRNVAAEPL